LNALLRPEGALAPVVVGIDDQHGELPDRLEQIKNIPGKYHQAEFLPA
jgi:hypothetical protein